MMFCFNTLVVSVNENEEIGFNKIESSNLIMCIMCIKFFSTWAPFWDWLLHKRAFSNETANQLHSKCQKIKDCSNAATFRSLTFYLRRNKVLMRDSDSNFSSHLRQNMTVYHN